MRPFLNKQNNDNKNEDFTEYRAHLRFEDFIEDPKTKRRDYAARQLADTTKNDHKERVDNVTLSQLRPDVTKLGERHATQPGNTRAQAKRQHIDAPRGYAAARRHGAVLRHRPHIHAQPRFVENKPGEKQHQ